MVRVGMSLAVGLAACAARVEVDVPGVQIDSRPTPKHCPPGHAKKGWCPRSAVPCGLSGEAVHS
jgi:hypothetical protein